MASARVAGFVKQRVHIAGDRHAVEIVFILHECRCYVWDDPSAISPSGVDSAGGRDAGRVIRGKP